MGSEVPGSAELPLTNPAVANVHVESTVLPSPIAPLNVAGPPEGEASFEGTPVYRAAVEGLLAVLEDSVRKRIAWLYVNHK